MPWYRMPSGNAIHLDFARRGNASAPRPCSVCGWISTRLCDWKLSGGGECSAPLCPAHAETPAPAKDLCPRHTLAYKGWLAGRTNSTDGAG